MRRRHAICFLVAIACGSSNVTVERTFDPAQSSIDVTPDSSVAGGDVLVRVTVRDSAGDPIEGLVVDIAVTGSANELTPVAPTDAAGVTTCTLRSTRAESKTVTASAGGIAIGTATVTYIPGPAVVLGFVTQPTAVEAGEPFPASVEVTDQFDNRTADTVAIHLELLPDATGAVLQPAMDRRPEEPTTRLFPQDPTGCSPPPPTAPHPLSHHPKMAVLKNMAAVGRDSPVSPPSSTPPEHPPGAGSSPLSREGAP